MVFQHVPLLFEYVNDFANSTKTGYLKFRCLIPNQNQMKTHRVIIYHTRYLMRRLIAQDPRYCNVGYTVRLTHMHSLAWYIK